MHYDENDHSQTYKEDCILIKDIIFKEFKIILSLKEAAHFWEETSSTYAAGWLMWDSEEILAKEIEKTKKKTRETLRKVAKLTGKKITTSIAYNNISEKCCSSDSNTYLNNFVARSPSG